MSNTFKVLFYLRKNHVNKCGKSGIMVRISINGERCAFSTKQDIEPELWDTKLGLVKGKSHSAMVVNNFLEDIRASIRNTYYDIEREEKIATAEKVKNAFLGNITPVKGETLLSVFKVHNDDFAKLIGVSHTQATYNKYARAYDRLKSFMKQEYNISDIALADINLKFITDFEAYLRIHCGICENTTSKYMQRFRRIVTMAMNNGWLTIDPFANYKIRFKKVDRGYLSEEELERIFQKRFSIERLEHVKDIFIFACFTGLAYVDLRNLTSDNIRKSFDGNMWIMTKRQKTDIAVNVPLLKIPKAILEKYHGKLPDGKLLPMMSNQRLNSYLKEIADICMINKNLTFHLA
ncbi:MAG: phage integrase SAM-like domain-containing protein, partial [Mangrovibacterium sp.]